MEKFFLPLPENNYTPLLLKRGMLILYTLFILIFNIITADISALQASAAIDSQSILTLHNQERKENGLSEFSMNSKLVESAQAKGTAMLANDCWDHYCPSGKSPWDFFDDAGYDYVYAGENLAEGFNENASVFDAWMNSKTHRENIIRGNFTEIGIGIVYGEFQGIKDNAIIVVHFGSQHENSGSTTYLPAQNENVSESILETETKINITAPAEGSLININTPEIKGTSPDGEIRLNIDGENIGGAISKKGIFTYRVPQKYALIDGTHEIQADLMTENLTDKNTFIVDTVAPEVKKVSFDSMSSGKDDIVTLAIETTGDTVSMENDQIDIKFSRVSDRRWTATTLARSLVEIDELKITSYDEAANQNEQSLDLSGVKAKITQIKGDYQYQNDKSINLPIISSMGIRKLINASFIIFIIILMMVDYYMLAKIDLPMGIVRAKTQYHISIFVILLIITFAGGTAGELLEGQNFKP